MPADVERILSDLIAFESVSAASNLPILAFIETALSHQGIASRRIPSRDGQKASLLATIGPADRPGVVLSAHMDVVPVDGQAWTSPPFAATRQGNRIVGRGATDMKGFLALALAHAPLFKASASGTPIHLALSYDEELGCLGAPDLAAALDALPVPAALCIVGEPTGMRVARAHKGKIGRRVVVLGRGGHSAHPHRAANAVMAGARIVAALGDIASEWEAAGGATSFDPPWTSVHVGPFRGGTALNLVPDKAEFAFEIRSVPGVDLGALLARIDAAIAAEHASLRRQAAESDIVVETLIDYPALDTPASSAAVRAVARLAEDPEPGTTVSFGTEAGIYAAAGIPTVVCGPGDIARAHKADEWIEDEELAAGCRMMERLAAELHRPAADWIET